MIFLMNNNCLMVNTCVYLYKADGSKEVLKEKASEQDFYNTEIKEDGGKSYKQICLQSCTREKVKFVYVGYIEDGLTDDVARNDFTLDIATAIDVINKFTPFAKI